MPDGKPQTFLEGLRDSLNLNKYFLDNRSNKSEVYDEKGDLKDVTTVKSKSHAEQIGKIQEAHARGIQKNIRREERKQFSAMLKDKLTTSGGKKRTFRKKANKRKTKKAIGNKKKG
jgi:hypothetical protein